MLEALASGTPMIATPYGNQGVGALPDREILTAQDPPAFARAALDLLANAPLRERLAQAARKRIECEFTWEQHARLLEEAYAKAGAV